MTLWGGGGVDALNRCHLSNWRLNPETVHFLNSKRPFLPTMFVSKCYKTKHFGQDSLFFRKKPKLGRKNHYFYSVKIILGGKGEITMKTTIWATIIENVVRKGRKSVHFGPTMCTVSRWERQFDKWHPFHAYTGRGVFSTN